MIAYVDSYDDISFPAAKHKFGHDVFDETWREVEDEVEDEIGSGFYNR
jgi:hypothetical protein